MNRPIDSHRSGMLDEHAASVARARLPREPLFGPWVTYTGEPIIAPTAEEANAKVDAFVRLIVAEELERLRQEELLPKRGHRASCALCIELAALHFGVEPAVIIGKRRTADVVQARHAAMWLAHKVTGQSSVQIARRFDRDHSSILHAVQHADELRAEDGDFEALTTAMISYFRVGV